MSTQVRARLASTLNVAARSATELCELMAKYECCLLILDRCEAAVQHARAQFSWFLDRLLQQAGVCVLISSQLPLSALPQTDDAIRTGSIKLSRMRRKDAALRILERLDRELSPAELGASDADSVLDCLTNHALIRQLDGLPSAVRWAARRLDEDATVPGLLDELRQLTPSQQTKIVHKVCAQPACAR